MNDTPREQERKNLNTVHNLGDIREDISFLGLKMFQLLIVASVILISSLLLFWLRLPLFLTAFLLAGIVGFTLATFLLRWPYRLKRFYTELYSEEEGTGEEIGEYLDAVEEGWLYRSNQTWSVVMKVSPPKTLAWDDTMIKNQAQRLGSFEEFLRIGLSENLEIEIDSEQVPDFQYEAWDQMREQPAPSEGIRRLRDERLDLMEEAVEKDLAMTYEYTLTLSIHDFQIKLMQRDDEPKGMDKDQTKRYRTIMAIREKVDRAMDCLVASGHSYSVVAGYNMAERVGRFYDYYGWREWKMTGGLWEAFEEESPNEYVHLPLDLAKEEPIMAEKEQEQEQEPTIHEDPMYVPEETYNSMLSAIHSSEEEPEEAEAQTGEQQPKVSQKPNAGLSRLKKLAGSVMLIPGMILPELKRLFALLHEMKQRRKVKKITKSTEAEVSDAVSTELRTELPQTETLTLKPITVITSSVPSGKSTLAVNIGVATALEGKYCTIVDLTPGQGASTILNTLLCNEDQLGWKIWETSRVKGLKIWTPTWNKTSYPAMNNIVAVIEQESKKGLVMIDMPWHYPGREELLDRYPAVAVVDSDYHHWIQMRREMTSFYGDIWMNQVPKHLLRPLTQMIREQWSEPITAVFPVFAEANECLLQGTPLALDMKNRTYFTTQQKEEDSLDETVQTSA